MLAVLTPALCMCLPLSSCDHFKGFPLQPTKTLVKNGKELILLTEPRSLALGASIAHVEGIKTTPYILLLVSEQLLLNPTLKHH